MMIASFLVFLALFALVGLSSFFFSRGSKKDYYLASRSMPPSLVGLSAVATNNSGYMFIGVIGYTYTTGLASIWLMIGWISGDYLISRLVHSRLREATERTGEVTYSGVLSQWYGRKFIILQRLIGLVSLIFLLAYASAQLVAGSKALQVLLDWPHWAGAVLGATLVLAYCLAGGIRASIWTDVAQSLVMITAMTILLVMTTQNLGGVSAAVTKMEGVDGFLDLFPSNLLVPGLAGMVLFVVGWGFAGLSVIGQPHVMVRFMTLGDGDKMRSARTWYYFWFTLFYLITTAVGMLSRIYLPDTASFDSELALPLMAQGVLPPVLVGLILAGIFAATMSTADSLVLSCSSAVTHDLLPQKIDKPRHLKIATGLITLVALGWALVNQQSVFSLVIMAWSGLASAFAPLLIVLALGGKPSQRRAIIAMFVGLVCALIWRLLGWHIYVYEGLPGILAGLALFVIPSKRK